jgi:hypothetical protein
MTNANRTSLLGSAIDSARPNDSAENADPLKGMVFAHSSAYEDVLEAFEEAWQGGTRPSIGHFLSLVRRRVPASSNIHKAVLEELVKIDLEYRWRNAPVGMSNHMDARSAPTIRSSAR